MMLHVSNLLLAMAPPSQPGQPAPPIWVNMVPLILMVVIFYFLLIRPQSKKAKEHAALLQTLKPGDKILTSGGILGIVVSLKDKTVTIRSADTKLEVLKSAISEVTERGGDSAQN